VEELQDVKSGGERDELHGKIDGFGDDLPEDFFGYVGRGEGTDNAKADFGKRQATEFFELFGAVAGDFYWHV
jgi:hypothetical protein